MVDKVGELNSYIELEDDWGEQRVEVRADNGEDIPADGRMILKEKYPILYSVLKDVMGEFFNETETEFAVPDFRGKVMTWKTGDPTEQ